MADLGRKVPRRQASQFANPERRTSATPLTPLAARKRAIAAGTTAPPEPHWGASLTRSRHPDYFLLTANATSQFAEEQMSASPEVFFTP